MRIGFMFRTFGAPGSDRPVPTWEMVRDSYLAADRAGFDVFTYEDALMYRTEDVTYGVMESMSLSAALAATPASIHFGQSVVNAPYRTGGMLAKQAATIDEISGGRYRLGIGAGNTDDADYRGFGYPTDKRFSRFADTIRIVHSLLKTGEADYRGEYDFAEKAELVLRGPSPEGPPIEIAAKGPKMLRLVARYADAWNGPARRRGATPRPWTAPTTSTRSTCWESARRRSASPTATSSTAPPSRSPSRRWHSVSWASRRSASTTPRLRRPMGWWNASRRWRSWWS
jgi:alkanesulfonate monooxygenase SsuD/methylene tetrahydromethanopterin reductase-like flavin-dependent oxidoreductase (luciferase family)